MTEPDLADESTDKQALDHAWNWFVLHAGQRMQTVNFFLLTTGFLTSAYSVALNADRPAVAVGVGILGALITCFFNRLEVRTKELVKASESVIKIVEDRLAIRAGIPELRMAERVETAKEPFSSYGRVIPAIQITVYAGFLLGTGFAIGLLIAS